MLFLTKDTGQLGFERLRDDARDGVTSPDAIATDRPTHVVATYDGATMRLFVDGELVASGPSTRELRDTPFAFRIGNVSDGSNPFEGSIGEAAVYDVALSERTVAEHYAAGARSP